MNRVEIPLAHGYKIVAEQNPDPDYSYELFVGIEDDKGSWFQDLALIRNMYRYKKDGQLDWMDDVLQVLVWSDSNSEDYTHDFQIPITEEWTANV